MRKLLFTLFLLLAVALPQTANAQDIHGDVNGDREVNIADVNAVIDVILGNGSNAAADVNSDGEISVADVNVLIDIILGSDMEPEQHEWVDLGLPSGTLWATCNVGADAPEEYGGHFAWGETETKDFYAWTTYKWCNGSKDSLTKYCTDSNYGTIDGKTELDLEDDAAWVNWGPSWRMPTHAQQAELLEYCSWRMTSRNGVNGYLLTGRNGNTLFIPMAGQFCYNSVSEGIDGAYWSRTLNTSGSTGAYYMYFLQGSSTNHVTRRDYGYSVRAVRVSPADSHGIHIEQQSLDLGGLTIGNTSTRTLTIVNNTMQAVTLTATADEPFSFRQQDGGSASSLTVKVPRQSIIPVTVTFTASTPGDFNGQVTFHSSALEGGQSVVPVHAFVISDEYLQQEYVDLGLPSGTLWATKNLGASSPMDFGSYFAWGETEPKTSFYPDNYTCSGYNAEDNKMELEPEDDAAWVNWGPSWRMPSLEQIRELNDNCSSQWTSLNNINGCLITGTNGNIIFLPAAGYGTGPSAMYSSMQGNYWTRTVRYIMEYDDYSQAYCLGVSSFGSYTNISGRDSGANVRAVRVSQDNVYIEQQSLDLGIVNVGNTSTGELTIINSSNEPITLTATTGEPFSFIQQDGSILSSMAVEVPGSSYTHVTVMFTASQPGEFNGEVSIHHPSLDGGQSVIPVHARAYADPDQDYVDLGLPSGTLWATRNIGANTPEEPGDFFAWGETEPKEEYYMSNYKWYDYDNELYTKYCTDSDYGMIDDKELEPRDDAAWANWGSSWRMPSLEQLRELREKCSWEWIERNGTYGYLVTGPNGNAIFLPAAGNSHTSPNRQGYYWARSLMRSDEPTHAYCLKFTQQGANLSSDRRSYGNPVRAVRMSLNEVYIDQQSLDFVASVGDTCTSLLTIVNCTNVPLPVMGSVDEPFYFNYGGGLVSSVTFDVPDKLYVILAVSFIATTPGQYNTKVTFRSMFGTVIEVPVSAYVFPDVNPQQDAVDLGLPSGTLWATCNVGASSPEELGDSFAWGETEPIGEPDWLHPWGNYKWCNGSEDTMTKYCTDSEYGTVDNLTELEPEDDAAWVNWGPMWRMPSEEQLTELDENCTWKIVTKNGVEGRLVIGPNGNYIFLPTAEDYWSRTLSPGFPFYALGRNFEPEDAIWWPMASPRNNGHHVRAVR